MACPNQNTQPAQQSSRGYIYETIVKIDQMQKAATIQNACEGCEGSLISAFYNTKPVTFYLCPGTAYTVTIPEVTGTVTTTSLFRIENVKNDAVILRLLTTEAGETTCTNFTAILKIDCICGMQCFAPICCDPCTSTCGGN